MKIREARKTDESVIRDVYLGAFPEEESELVAKLAVDLLAESSDQRGLSLVAESDECVVGHVAFSPVTIHGAEAFQGSILAPLGVKPEYQKRGIGVELVEFGIGQLSVGAQDAVFVYGDPKYYQRFGFCVETAQPFQAPYTLKYPFGWQALMLKDYPTDTSPLKLRCVRPLCDPRLW